MQNLLFLKRTQLIFIDYLRLILPWRSCYPFPFCINSFDSENVFMERSTVSQCIINLDLDHLTGKGSNKFYSLNKCFLEQANNQNYLYKIWQCSRFSSWLLNRYVLVTYQKAIHNSRLNSYSPETKQEHNQFIVLKHIFNQMLTIELLAYNFVQLNCNKKHL